MEKGMNPMPGGLKRGVITDAVVVDTHHLAKIRATRMIMIVPIPKVEGASNTIKDAEADMGPDVADPLVYRPLKSKGAALNPAPKRIRKPKFELVHPEVGDPRVKVCVHRVVR